MNCTRCNKPATCIGIEGSGERYQCRFCTNEWIRKTVPEVMQDARAEAEAKAVAKRDADGNLVVSVTRKPVPWETAIAAAKAADRNGHFAALSELEDYLIMRDHELSGKMTGLGPTVYTSAHSILDHREMLGARKELALLRDLINAKLKKLNTL